MQAQTVGVVWRTEEGVSLGLFHDLPGIHDCYRVTDLGHHRNIVGDQQDGQIQFFFQTLQDFKYLMLHNDI